MYQKFDDLLKDLQQNRPSNLTPQGRVFFFNDQSVLLQHGELEGITWVDIHIELKRFHIENLSAAKKVLQANCEMGNSTPIPSWFAINVKNDCLVFINRLDWRHLTCKILEDHILRCIEQMGSALTSEGV
ncbi:MAG: hypothetical protein A0129_12705 [Limnobacter sp. CACIAM 66H1]|jgi:hypothetical protein|uniref:hypothetical protein n=1 Tax=unclassified Limnobacter TaxID=2630203 RepID=UPI0007A84F7F|nr:hypothetical protein [Limnobacter sp. CACIAM 66H1]KYP10453.1 MAG: hypothetical protein A0129_12705 [Limnobacter sp. CACIAM 66H1]